MSTTAGKNACWTSPDAAPSRLQGLPSPSCGSMAFSQLGADNSPNVQSIQISEGARSKQRPKDNVEKNGGTLHMASPACDWGSQGVGGQIDARGSTKD